MTRRVVGLDLSLTSAGVAIVTETSRGLILNAEVFRSQLTKSGRTPKGAKRETVTDRYARLRDHSAAIIHHAATADLVVLEGLVTGPGGGVQDRIALWWIVAGAMIRRDVPLAVVSPSAWKKALTGKGTADKVEVALVMAKLWPDTDLGNNDTSDAAALAHLGAVALGWPVETRESHRHVVWTDWPEFVIEGAVA